MCVYWSSGGSFVDCVVKYCLQVVPLLLLTPQNVVGNDYR